MKIHLLSDLHLEFRPFEPPPTDADVVVLAGDIDVGTRGIDWALRTFPDRPVLYVAGNHEYYHHAIPTLTARLAARAADTHVHFLENAALVLDGVRFLGCTLWSDFDLFGNAPLAALDAVERMNDYRMIHHHPEFEPLRPAHTAAMHARSLEWLHERLAEPVDVPTVVITHHAPSPRSVPERWKSDLLTPAFASRLDAFVARSGASAWLHGHVHEVADYGIAATRVVANPRGYSDDEVGGFVPGLVVEV